MGEVTTGNRTESCASGVPVSYLKDSTDGIIYRFREIGKARVSKKAFEIHWNSSCIDGAYYLTITPMQIYLTSAHENPNPNMLFGVLNIDKISSKQIINGFQKSNHFINGYFDEMYNDK